MRILIVGLGALGSRSAPQLAKYPLTLCDYDIVERDNTLNQAYTERDIGRPKTVALAEHIKKTHPDADIQLITGPFTAQTPLDGISLIIDGTDSLETRQHLNNAAKQGKIPLIIAAAGTTGGIVFPATADGPCWECITHGKISTDDCTRGAPRELLDTVVKEQVRLAVRIAENKDMDIALTLVDTNGHTRTIAVNKNPRCEACKGTYATPKQRIRHCHKRTIASRVINLAQVRKLRVLDDYGTAVRVAIGDGWALVHQHGSIEFSDVSDEEAEAFLHQT